MVEIKAGSIVVSAEILPPADGAPEGERSAAEAAEFFEEILADQSCTKSSCALTDPGLRLRSSASFMAAGGVTEYQVVEMPGGPSALTVCVFIVLGCLCCGVLGVFGLKWKRKQPPFQADPEAAGGGKAGAPEPEAKPADWRDHVQTLGEAASGAAGMVAAGCSKVSFTGSAQFAQLCPAFCLKISLSEA